MKIQVIQLDPHDDYISARDKIGWSKTGRVLLVFPERNIGFNRQLDLVLLKRHCTSLGAQMALVTKDEDIRFRSHELGITTFSSVTAAYRKYWRTGNQHKKVEEQNEKIPGLSRRENIFALKTAAHPHIPKWKNRLEVRLLFFAIGVIAVLAITSVLIPAANITLKPVTQEQAITIQISADAKNEAVNISGAIPVDSISVKVEGRDQIASTGTIDIPAQLAIGSVIFSNLTDKPVTVPAGTVVRTSGEMPVRFATIQEIEIEAGYGITQSVRIQALKPGISGNVAEGSLTAIEGLLGINLAVENIEPTSGGDTFTTPAPAAIDEKKLYEKLYKSLVESAMTEVKNKLNEADVLLSSHPIKVDVITKEFSPSEPLPADQLNLTLQLNCQFIIAKAEDLKQLSQMSLDVNLPEGYLPIEESLVYTNISEPVGTESEGYFWQMSASRHIQAIITPNDAINIILGLRLEEASVRLTQSLPLADTPQIIIIPSWWKRLPILPFRVNVFIQ